MLIRPNHCKRVQTEEQKLKRELSENISKPIKRMLEKFEHKEEQALQSKKPPKP